jgi:ABC-2 type transport system permease protein
MVFKREFLKNSKSLMIWCVVIAGLILMMLSIFPSFAGKSSDLDKLIKMYPQAAKNAFGLNELNMGTLIGFYGVEIHLMVTLIGSIYSAILAGNILAKEESEKTIEFLLSKPISRTRIVTEKLICVLVNILIFNAVVVISGLIGFQFSKNTDLPIKAYTLLILGGILLDLTFAAILFLISAIARKTKTVFSAAFGIVLVSYFINVVAGLSDKFKELKYLSFFKYVDAAHIVKKERIDSIYLFIMAAIIVICTVYAYIHYQKKDIAV